MTTTAWLLSLAVIFGTLVLLPFAIKSIVSSEDVKKFSNDYNERIREFAPYVALMFSIPILNIVLRNVFEEFFYDAGIEITGLIYGWEGYLVSIIQQFATPKVTSFMTFAYIFLYFFIIVLTTAVYLFDSEKIYLKQLIIAFAINYGIGLISYLVFIAYGPRVFIDSYVEGLMYQAYPFIWELTSLVNTPSNVFPSLHTSISVTVALFSLSTVKKYPKLPIIVVTSAILVIISTMYLGIHWFIDVLAGTILGTLSYLIATNYTKISLPNNFKLNWPFNRLTKVYRNQKSYSK